jgi:putative transposase
MDKYQGKYRIPSSRWHKWDYGLNAAYYVTICTHQHVCYFGEVVEESEKIMVCNQMGSIALQYWSEIPNHFPFVELDAFVLMPNHLHGIIIINKPDGDGNAGSDAAVETRLIASLQSVPISISQKLQYGGITGDKNPMLYENLSRIVRWYKGRCSYEIHKLQSNFNWQPRFHDRIIRDFNEYMAIKNYIDNNVQKWNGSNIQ